MGDLEAFAAISDLRGLVADEVINTAHMITRIENDLRTQISAARRDLDPADAALTAGD